MTNLTKMSKSKGNGISVDEVVKGVYALREGYEFRDQSGELVDYKKERVWQDKSGYRTFIGAAVFLHEVDNPVPCMLGTKLQHPHDYKYWSNLLDEYETC